jgi:uncharacterized integral membrane protein
VLLVIAAVLLVLAVANHGVTVAFDLIVTTWHVSLAWLLVIAAGLVVVVGLGATLAADLRAADQRRALETELESTYTRLREAQAAAGLEAAPAAETSPPADTATSPSAADAPPPADAPSPAGPDGA